MKRRLSLVAVLAIVAIACITINVYFPEAAVKELSERIEDEVAAAAAAPTPTPTPTPAPEARLEPPVPVPGLGFLALNAWAGDDEVPVPEITNPAIRKLIASRAARLGRLNAYKARGVLGESNQGLVVVRDLDSVSSLRERAEVQRLVKAENADREQLFREIAAAKKVDLSQLAKIRSTYAATLREKARPGDWVQTPDGRWTEAR